MRPSRTTLTVVVALLTAIPFSTENLRAQQGAAEEDDPVSVTTAPPLKLQAISYSGALPKGLTDVGDLAAGRGLIKSGRLMGRMTAETPELSLPAKGLVGFEADPPEPVRKALVMTGAVAPADRVLAADWIACPTPYPI